MVNKIVPDQVQDKELKIAEDNAERVRPFVVDAANGNLSPVRPNIGEMKNAPLASENTENKG